MKKYAMISIGMAALSIIFFLMNWGYWNLLVPKIVDYDSPLRRVAQCAGFLEYLLLAGSVIVLGVGSLLTQKPAESTTTKPHSSEPMPPAS